MASLSSQRLRSLTVTPGLFDEVSRGLLGHSVEASVRPGNRTLSPCSLEPQTATESAFMTG